MPLHGVVDPSHYERAHDAPGRLPRWLTLDEVLMEAQNPSPKWAPWTFEMVQAVLGEHQERLDNISTTALVDGDARAEIIKRKVPYIGSLDNMYMALRGTMVHRTLEAYPRLGAIAEHRFVTTVDGIEISCSPDLLTTDTLTDYKVPSDVTGVPSFGYPFQHQTHQLMVNAFIVRHMERWNKWVGGVKIDNPDLPFDPREYPVKNVIIVYIGPKMPKVIVYERTEEFLTAAGKWKKTKRPYVWDDEETLAFLRPRLHLFSNALESYPEWPEPWTDPDTEEEHTFESVFGGEPGWRCPGPPLCKLPGCLAQQYPDRLVWENPPPPEKRERKSA